MPKTLFDKIWESHEVGAGGGTPSNLIYIDLHLVHEVTSPQAFDGLRLAGRKVRRPDKTIATADHNVPTDGTPVAARIKDALSRVQVETLEKNCAEFGVPVFSLGSDRQGIVHVVGPEQGLTQPNMTIVCGDSHTSTHGAFGAIAFGIGTSEVEHVLATQTLPQVKPKTMAINVEGALPDGVSAKDLILAIIGQIGTPNSAQLASRVWTCTRLSSSLMRAATGVPSVGTLWSAVASVRSGRRTLRPARRSPSKACGLVTSWTRCKSM